MQNPARFCCGPALFERKESSPAEMGHQLSLSLTTGQCDVQLQRWHGDSSGTHGPLDAVHWVSVCRCWQQRWPLSGQSGWVGVCQSAKVKPPHVNKEQLILF